METGCGTEKLVLTFFVAVQFPLSTTKARYDVVAFLGWNRIGGSRVQGWSLYVVYLIRTVILLGNGLISRCCLESGFEVGNLLIELSYVAFGGRTSTKIRRLKLKTLKSSPFALVLAGPATWDATRLASSTPLFLENALFWSKRRVE